MPILTNADIAKRFKTDENDTVELVNIQNQGVDYGKRGVDLDSEEFEDDARFDIEHTETLLDLPEGSVLRLFRAAYREGVKEARAATPKRKRARGTSATETVSATAT